jgi:flavin-dependent dehydrogenase
MAAELEVEICIIGGGPAGAVLARRLAMLGHSVVVVERTAHSARVRGEVLHAAAWPVLDQLGITRDVLGAGARPIHRSLVLWSEDALAVREHEVPQLAVLRPRFDAVLLALAQRAGAMVLQPAVAAGARRDRDGWLIAVEHRGRVLDVRARMIGDASGRAAWRRTGREQLSARTFAMRGLWSGRMLPAEARVEAIEDGWLSGAPIGGDRYAVMAVVDGDTPLGIGRYLTSLGASQLFREFDALAQLDEDLDYCEATCYAARAAFERGILRVGDASYSLDPLAPSGVHTALGSALHAGAAIHTLLLHPDRELLVQRYYEDTRRAEIARHRAAAARQYGECAWRSHAFWDRRTAVQLLPRSTPPADDAIPLDPATTRVALSAGVALEEMPCVSGDVIEARLGVTSGSRDRPFVWVAGVAIAPLVAPLVSRPMTPVELLATWRHVPPGRHRELLDWLLRERIVQPVAPRDRA